MPALDVVVRFSTSIPDVVLPVEAPSTVSTETLKQRIRERLEPPASSARLRLIHSGRVLADRTPLSRSLHVAPPPPLRDDDASSGAKAKGKQAVRHVRHPAARVYVHCSVGDPLSAADLAAEARQAREADAALLSEPAAGHPLPQQDGAPTTTPPPRGFDRLLSAGFTASEVAALRTQFLAIQAHTHTPETMPAGPDLLALEERWLDSSSSSADAAGGGADTGGFGSEDAEGLEDMLYGNLIGFFWPIGAMCWLMREEGVWSRRRQIAVLSGFIVNLCFGFVRTR